MMPLKPLRALVVGGILLLSLPALAAEDASWMTYNNPYAKTDLTTPHRTDDQIISFAERMAAEILTLKPETYVEQLDGFKQSFEGQSWEEYSVFLISSQIYDFIREDGYATTAVVKGRGKMGGKGVVNHSYHWIVSVPLIVSFGKAPAEGKEKRIGNNYYVMKLQLARVRAQSNTDDGLVINAWKIEKSHPY
jgi:hypothetical protein